MGMIMPALGNIPNLAASEKGVVGNINCNRIRTLSLTTKVTYGAATKAVRVLLYFSPDGKVYDTVPYIYFDIDLTASSTVQETHIVNMPEGGYMDVRVENLDASVAATNILIFYTVKRWAKTKGG